MVVQCRGSAALEHVQCKHQTFGTEFQSPVKHSSLVPQHLQCSLSLALPCVSVTFYLLAKVFAIPFEIFLFCHPKKVILHLLFCRGTAQSSLIHFSDFSYIACSDYS